MFSPGETVAHQFIIPFVANEISKVVVSYKQDDDIVLEKTITSGFKKHEVSAKTEFIVTLSQQESLLFNEIKDLYIQLNVYTKEGARATSTPIRSANGYQFYKEVISNG